MKLFFIQSDGRLLNPSHTERIRLLLGILNAANRVEELNIVGAHLHELKGKRKGTRSMRVSGNWRLTFESQDGNAYNVDLEDYH